MRIKWNTNWEINPIRQHALELFMHAKGKGAKESPQEQEQEEVSTARNKCTDNRSKTNQLN